MNDSGLSPRERGNRISDIEARQSLGSIPARAGEPAPRRRESRPRAVYPRASGGTLDRGAEGEGLAGLSPRERGNLPRPHWWLLRVGSIPARAGEPWIIMALAAVIAVYPRASGGTPVVLISFPTYTGLSPRERGNPPADQRVHDRDGSIPARAGEPAPARAPAPVVQVYPRASGGTAPGKEFGLVLDGLSPRERGNRLPHAGPVQRGRSIPARAGEPAHHRRAPPTRTVYPRASGGTSSAVLISPSSSGLSPRERGNRSEQERSRPAEGSIPARAGEPGVELVDSQLDAVYPRASGGTRMQDASTRHVTGLSPRERGNRSAGVPYDAALRSIPARAGEPPSVVPMACRM